MRYIIHEIVRSSEPIYEMEAIIGNKSISVKVFRDKPDDETILNTQNLFEQKIIDTIYGLKKLAEAAQFYFNE